MPYEHEVVNGVLYRHRTANSKFSEFESEFITENVDLRKPVCIQDINNDIDSLRSIITCNSDLILKGYSIIKSKTDNLLIMNRKRDFIDINLAMHNYAPYINGMIDYINLVLSLKPGEVSVKAVDDKITTAEDKDSQWVSSQFMKDNNNLTDGLEKITSILDCVGMLQDYAVKAQTMHPDESDTDLFDVKRRAVELLWQSLKTFANNAISGSNENIRAIDSIVNGTKPAPQTASDDSGFRML